MEFRIVYKSCVGPPGQHETPQTICPGQSLRALLVNNFHHCWKIGEENRKRDRNVCVWRNQSGRSHRITWSLRMYITIMRVFPGTREFYTQTLQDLGFRVLHRTVVETNTSAVRYMINKVRHSITHDMHVICFFFNLLVKSPYEDKEELWNVSFTTIA